MHQLVDDIKKGSYRSLARAISLVENQAEGYLEILHNSAPTTAFIIGITGPPGAGKSTIVDALVGEIVSANKRVGILCVDPSSPFNLGALLGDRVRMNQWYNHPNVFIRSLATRGSLGGLHPHILDIVMVMQAANFDYVIIETVGVGQSEVEIAGLADTTIVAMVPEAGDDIQTMKAGLMEIADIFVVNKSDRPGADQLVMNLTMMLASDSKTEWQVPVLKTSAINRTGIEQLIVCIDQHHQQQFIPYKRHWLLAEKAYQLIQQKRMKDIDKHQLKNAIEAKYSPQFNLYTFIEEMDKHNT